MGFHGALMGVLNVRLRSSIAFEIGNNVIQCYRLEIVSLDAGIEESFVHLPIFDHLMAMKVTVYAAQIVPAKIVGMHGNVREDEAAWQGIAAMVKHCPANIFKMLCVVFELKSVVIAPNKNFPSIALS